MLRTATDQRPAEYVEALPTGQGGNPSGRPKHGTSLRDIVQAQPVEEKEAIVRQMVVLAPQGNVRVVEGWRIGQRESRE
jgi:hypothetical protein